MLYILTEPIYRDSIWCSEILSGIKTKAKEKKAQFCFIDSVREIKEAGQLILVGTSLGWSKGKIDQCKDLNVKTVVVTPKIPVNEKLPCSFVGSDSEGAVINMISLLKSKGRNRIALYGVNPDSVNDLCKKNCFVSQVGDESGVFYNNGDINGCFNEFYKKELTFEAVLCTNSYAAFHLVKALKSKSVDFGNLFIISLSDSRLLQFSAPCVTAVDIDYKELGKAAFDACRILDKNPSLTTVNMVVEWKVTYRQTTSGLTEERKEDVSLAPVSEKLSAADVFYNDGEIVGMMTAENLLECCDVTDLKLLSLLQRGSTYEQISKELFISESGIKYRIKKLTGVTKTSSREQLLNLLENYGIEL